jgi:hypothetical protein
MTKRSAQLWLPHVLLDIVTNSHLFVSIPSGRPSATAKCDAAVN